MGKIISYSVLILLVCAGLGFAEDDDDVRMIPISKNSVEGATAVAEAPAAAEAEQPIPCGESEVIKNLNEPDGESPRCFEISADGTVTFNKKSRYIVKLEKKSSVIRLVCKVADEPEEKKTYLFLMTKNRLNKLLDSSHIAVQMNYDGNGRCFDITNTKQAAKPMPRMRSPASELK